MERISRKNLEARTKIVARHLKRKGAIATDAVVHLSRMSFGDGQRWQIEVHRDGGIDLCFPSRAHYKTRAFDTYLDGLMDGLLKTSAHGSATVKVYRCPSSGWTKTANRFYLPGDTSRDVSGVDPGALVGRAVLLNSYCCICDVEHWHVHMVDDPDGQHEQVLIWRP